MAGPRLSDDQIAEAVEVNRSTVERVRMRCVEEGVEAALRPRLEVVDDISYETVRRTLKKTNSSHG